MVEIKFNLTGKEDPEKVAALLGMIATFTINGDEPITLTPYKTKAEIETGNVVVSGGKGEDPEPEKKPATRKRRTRAEIEADKKKDDKEDPNDDDDDDDLNGLFDLPEDDEDEDSDELDTDDPKHMARLTDLLTEVNTDKQALKKIQDIMTKKVKAKSTKNLSDEQKKILYAELKKLQK